MIPVSEPLFGKNASKYLLECLKTGWVSSRGTFVERFENAFAKFIGTKYAVACTNGTHALHLSLAALNIGPGDEVIVPTMTMVATVMPIIYLGAKPVLVDSEKVTGNIDVNLIEKKITRKTKAIIPVHLHGHPVDMDKLLILAKKYHLKIIEDAAEAHGAKYYSSSHKKWQKVGSIGDFGCFSFYANKIITSGEGGMVTTNDKKMYERLKQLRNFFHSKKRHFYHEEISFAYRMSNLQAALGLANLENAKNFIAKKITIAKIYTKSLNSLNSITLPFQKTYAKNVYWHYAVIMNEKSNFTRDKLAILLTNKGIETRNFFIPMHLQPAFVKMGLFKNEHFPVAEKLAKNGLCLPSGLALTKIQQNFVCHTLKKILTP